MNQQEFLAAMRRGESVAGSTEGHEWMHKLADQAQQLTAQLNGSYHTPEEIRQIMSEIIGKPVDETFCLFPPFYTDCGKNITIGKNVFINSACHFQDQGGVTIEDGCLIGPQVEFATINHGQDPAHRSDNHFAPIHLKKRGVDRRPRHHPSRGDHWGELHCGGGGGGHQRRACQRNCSRRSCPGDETHRYGRQKIKNSPLFPLALERIPVTDSDFEGRFVCSGPYDNF